MTITLHGTNGVTTAGITLGSTAIASTGAELNILDGVTSTAAELNLIDGGTARGTTAVADGDGFLTNDGGTMRMTKVETLATYINTKLHNRLSTDGDILLFQKNGTTVGSIGVAGSELFIGSTSGTDSYLGFGANLLKPVSSTGAGRTGAISLGNANARFKDLYLSGGVYLGGTGSANFLDDYEEGNWTIGVTVGGSAQTVASGAVANYTKIGDTVSIRFRVGFSKSGSGAVNITGLPFASGAGSTVSVPIGCAANSVTSTAALFANIDNSSTIVHLADQAGDLTNSDFASTANLFGSFTYQA